MLAEEVVFQLGSNKSTWSSLDPHQWEGVLCRGNSDSKGAEEEKASVSLRQVTEHDSRLDEWVL